MTSSNSIPLFLSGVEHQVSHLVGSQLGKMQGITNTVENVIHRPFAERLAWVSLRIGEENGAVPVSTVAPDESSAIFFDICFEPDKGWVRENDGSWHVVLRGLSSNGDGMGSPINIIKAHLDKLLTAQCPIMGEQHNDLIAKRAVGQHMLQDGFPLPLVGNPGNRGGTRDEAPLLASNAFANGIEGISPVTEPDTPAVEAAERTDAPSDRRWCEFGPRSVANLAAIPLLPSSLLRFSLPEPIDVVSNPAFIGLDEFFERDIREGAQQVVEVPTQVL